MPLIRVRRMDALAARSPRRRPGRMRLATLISVLIHVAIGVMLLVTIHGRGGPEQLPPPSPVTMLFDSGRRAGPTLPNPELQATPSTPPAPATPPAPLPTPPAPPTTEPPPSPPPPAPAPPAPPAPAPPAPPAPATPAPPEPTPPAPAEPAPPSTEAPPPEA